MDRKQGVLEEMATIYELRVNLKKGEWRLWHMRDHSTRMEPTTGDETAIIDLLLANNSGLVDSLDLVVTEHEDSCAKLKDLKEEASVTT